MASEVIKKIEKATIVIKTAGAPTEFGTGEPKAKKLSFQTERGISVQTFATALFPLIKSGATIVADMELRKNGQYENWTLTQIYVDGKPMAEKGKGGYGGGKSYGKSPEERLSIEDQVRVKAITELVISGKVALEDILGKKLVAYLSKLGGAAPRPEPVKEKAVEEKKAEKPSEQAELGSPPPPEPEPEPDKPVSATTLATLKGVAKASGLPSLAISAIIVSEFSRKAAKNLTEKEALELIDGLNKGRWKDEK